MIWDHVHVRSVFCNLVARNRFILGEWRLVSDGNRAICMVFGRFYSGRVSRVERGRGVLAGKGIL